MARNANKKTTRNAKKKSPNPVKELQSQLAQLKGQPKEKDIVKLFSAKYLNNTKCLKKLSDRLELEKDTALFAPHLTACAKRLLQHTSFKRKFSSEDCCFQLVRLYQILLSQHEKLDLSIFPETNDDWNNLPYLFIRQASAYAEEEIVVLEKLFCASGEIVERLFADASEDSADYRRGLTFTKLQKAIYSGFVQNNQGTQTFWMYFNQLKGLESANQENLQPLYKLRLATALINTVRNTVLNASLHEKYEILAPYFSTAQWYRKFVKAFTKNKQNEADLNQARTVLADIEYGMEKTKNLSEDFTSAYTTFFTATLSKPTDDEHIKKFLIEVLGLINQSEFQEKEIDTTALFSFLAAGKNKQKISIIKQFNHAFTSLAIPITTNQVFFIKIFQAWLDSLTHLKAAEATKELITEYDLRCGIHDKFLDMLSQRSAPEGALIGLLNSIQKLHAHIQLKDLVSANDNSDAKKSNLNAMLVTEYKATARQIKAINQSAPVVNYFQLTQLHHSLAEYAKSKNPALLLENAANWDNLPQWLLPEGHILFEDQLNSLEKMHSSLTSLIEELLAHNTDKSLQYSLALGFLKQQEIIYFHLTTTGKRHKTFWRYFKQIELALIDSADHLSNTNKLLLGETYLSILKKAAHRKENDFFVPYASAKYWFRNFLLSANKASVDEEQLIAANKKYQQNNFFVATTGDLNKRFEEAYKRLLDAILAEETTSKNNSKNPITSHLCQFVEKTTSIIYASEFQKVSLDTTRLFDFLNAEEVTTITEEDSETETTEEANETESTEKISAESPTKPLLLRDLNDIFATLIIPLNTNLDLFFKLYQAWIDFLVSLEAQNTRALLLMEYELMVKLHHKLGQTLAVCNPTVELITSFSQSLFKLNMHIGHGKLGEFSGAPNIKEKLFNYLTEQFTAALSYIKKLSDKTSGLDTTQSNGSSEDKIETNTAIATPSSESSKEGSIPRLYLNIFNNGESSNDGTEHNQFFPSPTNVDFSSQEISESDLDSIRKKINKIEPDDSLRFTID